MPRKKNKSIKEVEKDGKIVKVKKSLTKKDYDFLNAYARTHNKQKSIEEAGLDRKSDGTKYTAVSINEKAELILMNEQAQEYVKKLHAELFKSHCHDLERCITETYDLYLTFLEMGKFRECNIAHQRYVELCGFLNKDNKINVNTQIVDNGNGITINYINPNEPKKE